MLEAILENNIAGVDRECQCRRCVAEAAVEIRHVRLKPGEGAADAPGVEQNIRCANARAAAEVDSRNAVYRRQSRNIEIADRVIRPIGVKAG